MKHPEIIVFVGNDPKVAQDFLADVLALVGFDGKVTPVQIEDVFGFSGQAYAVVPRDDTEDEVVGAMGAGLGIIQMKYELTESLILNPDGTIMYTVRNEKYSPGDIKTFDSCCCDKEFDENAKITFDDGRKYCLLEQIADPPIVEYMNDMVALDALLDALSETVYPADAEIDED